MWTRVRHERAFRKLDVRCCTRDEGRPLGVGVQAQAPNRLKPQGLRVSVVSVEEKAGQGAGQVRPTETSGSEPLRTCRKYIGDVKTRGVALPWEQCGGHLCTAPTASGLEAA
jgi:hypothetical protein